MRIRTLALAIAAVGLLAVGTAAPSPANGIKEFEGTIALPAPIVSGEMAQDWASGGALRQTCPDPGAGDGVFYKFFDLEADYKHFFVSGPELIVDEPDPTGVLGGSVQDYDLDLYAYDAKCNPLDIEGTIMSGNGVGNGSVAGKTPARYAVVAYFAGPPELPVLLEASNAPIKK